MRPPDHVNGWILQFGSTASVIQYVKQPGGELRKFTRESAESEQQFVGRVMRLLMSK